MDEGFQRILATPSQRKQIQNYCKCDKSTVSLALAFKKNGKKCREVRAYAVNILKCQII